MSPGVVVNKVGCDIVVSESKLQSWKAMAKWFYYCSTRMALALNRHQNYI